MRARTRRAADAVSVIAQALALGQIRLDRLISIDKILTSKDGKIGSCFTMASLRLQTLLRLRVQILQRGTFAL